MIPNNKEKMIINAIDNFHINSNRGIKKLDSFRDVPGLFKDSSVFGLVVFSHYKKKGGQFFFVNTGKGKKYIVLLLNGNLAALNELGENVSPSQIESEMKINKFEGVGLKDVLEHLMKTQISESNIYIKNKNMKKVIRLTESDLVKLVKKVIKEQDSSGFVEPASKEGGNEFDHFNNIVKPKLIAAGFKLSDDPSLAQYGKRYSLIFGDHNTGVNVLWNQPHDGKTPWSYDVWVGNNKGLKSFPLGGNINSKSVANNVVNYALSLKH